MYLFESSDFSRKQNGSAEWGWRDLGQAADQRQHLLQVMDCCLRGVGRKDLEPAPVMEKRQHLQPNVRHPARHKQTCRRRGTLHSKSRQLWGAAVIKRRRGELSRAYDVQFLFDVQHICCFVRCQVFVGHTQTDRCWNGGLPAWRSAAIFSQLMLCCVFPSLLVDAPHMAFASCLCTQPP